ncbi:MAG: type V CRISPR-associated protein Cas4, partial [Candidatus Taylorbacteria bacterium]|nr:type V CRISPR-associated protein Cas4 [Candidatus Taylorbacteria bacterium]
MEPYIQISKINDFVYCPVSIYLHSLYENFNTKTYHQTPQIAGTLNHESIETRTYTTSRRFIMGLDVSSERYNLVGKIDLYDQ